MQRILVPQPWPQQMQRILKCNTNPTTFSVSYRLCFKAHRQPHILHTNMANAPGGFTASEETHLDGWESPRTAKKHADEKAKTKMGSKLSANIVKKDRFGRVVKKKEAQPEKEGNAATKLLVRLFCLVCSVFFLSFFLQFLFLSWYLLRRYYAGTRQ